jgi:hypothetical protein
MEIAEFLSRVLNTPFLFLELTQLEQQNNLYISFPLVSLRTFTLLFM